MAKNNQYDDTRNKFTSWIKKVIHSAKIDYVRSLNREIKTVSLEKIVEKDLVVEIEPCGSEQKLGLNELEIGFENETLSKAFSMLSKRRREILLLLFVEEYDAAEIAELLNVGVQSVHNERNRALKKLREYILSEENRNG